MCRLFAFIVTVLLGSLSLIAAYPTDLWVVGNISDMTWSYNNAVKCANLGNGKYQALVFRVMNSNGDNSGKYYGNFRLTESLGDNVTNRKVYGSPESTTVRFSNGQSKTLIAATNTVKDYALPDVAGSYMLSIDLAAGTISVNSSYTPDVMYLLRNMKDGKPQDISVQLNRVGTSQQYSGSEVPMKFQAADDAKKCFYYVSAANGNQWSVINAERYGLASSIQLEDGTATLASGAELALFTKKEGTFDVSFNRQTKQLSINPSRPDLYLVGTVNGMTWDQRGNGEKIKYVASEKCYYATIVPNVSNLSGIAFAFTSRANGNISDSDRHRYAGSASNQTISVGSNVLCRGDVYNVTSSYALPAEYRGVTLYARISLDNQTMLLQTTPFANSDAPKANPYNEVWSPNGKVGLVSTIENGKPYYKVISNNEWVVNKSPLGLVSDAVDYTQNLKIISAESRQINESYYLPSGKTSTYVNNCRELTIHLQTAAGQPFDIVFRASNDGVAFRYVIPSQNGKSSIIIKDEASAVNPTSFKYILGCKFASQKSWPKNFPYESYYGQYGSYGEYTDWNTAVTDASDPRFNEPVLIGSGNQNILISEAENVGTYSISLLKAYTSPTGCLMWQHAGDSYQAYKDDVKNNLTVKLPLETPWRTLQIGDLPSIFASTMQENLCKPSVVSDMSWIEPGTSSWDWGGSENKGYGSLSRFDADKKYIDMAARMGWKYVLVDGGWNETAIRNTVKYAVSKGVKVLLWGDSRLKNTTAFSNENMEGTLRKWKEWGVSGIKIDFWEDDSRETAERMELLLKLTAKYKMNVNFHGCTRPSGLRRTYPHVLSYEGILGGENIFLSEKNRGFMTTKHHICNILTRNVVGPADYTPIDFAMVSGRLDQNFSFAQNLGLSVAYENGLLHITESYQHLLPFGPAVITKRIPATWDESRLLESALSKYLTIARRKGNDWWLAGLTVSARTANINLSQLLPAGKTYTAYIYRDGDKRNKVVVEKKSVTSATTLSIAEINEGGFLVQISENANLEMPNPETTYEAESSANELSEGLTVETVTDAELPFTSGNKIVGQFGKGRKLTFKGISVPKDDFYTVTIYYTTKDDRSAECLVNGTSIGNITFTGNGVDYLTTNCSWIHVEVPFKAGSNNTFALVSPSGGWSPDIDRITVCAQQSSNKNTDIPDNLYVVGSVFGSQSWKDSYTASDVFKCHNAGNGIFYVNLWTSDATNRNSFTFSSTLGDNATVMANRYGASNASTTLQPGTSSQFVSIPTSGSFNFSLPKANTMYYATIDTRKGTISVREASSTELPDVIYFVHSTNVQATWDLNDASQPAVRNSAGQYVFKGIHIVKETDYQSGWYRFVASPTGAAGCKIDNFYGTKLANESDSHITAGEDIKLNRGVNEKSSFTPYGVYDIVVSTADNRIYISGTQPMPDELYLVGNVNERTYSSANDELIKCHNAGNGIYYVTISYAAGATDDGTFYFTSNSEDPTNPNYKYCGNVASETIAMGETKTCGAALLNTSACYKLSATGKYYATIDFNNGTVTLGDEPNILYLVRNKGLGEIYDSNWNLFDDSNVLVKTAPNQYFGKNIVLPEEKFSNKCYFCFTSVLPRRDVQAYAWNTVKLDRWGANEGVVAEFPTESLINDREVYYNVASGTYNIIVDLGINTVLLYDAATEDYEGFKIRLINGRAADTTHNGMKLDLGYCGTTEYHVANFVPAWNIGTVGEWPQVLVEKDGVMLMHGKQDEDCISGDDYCAISTDKSFTGRTYLNPQLGPFYSLVVEVENGAMRMIMMKSATAVDKIESHNGIDIRSGAGFIKVTGVDTYTITSMSGTTFTSKDAVTRVTPGFYIVKAGNKIEKVIVR